MLYSTVSLENHRKVMADLCLQHPWGWRSCWASRVPGRWSGWWSGWEPLSCGGGVLQVQLWCSCSPGNTWCWNCQPHTGWPNTWWTPLEREHNLNNSWLLDTDHRIFGHYSYIELSIAVVGTWSCNPMNLKAFIPNLTILPWFEKNCSVSSWMHLCDRSEFISQPNMTKINTMSIHSMHQAYPLLMIE